MFLPFDDSVGSKGASLNHSAMKRKLYMVKSYFLNTDVLHSMRELSLQVLKWLKWGRNFKV